MLIHRLPTQDQLAISVNQVEYTRLQRQALPFCNDQADYLLGIYDIQVGVTYLITTILA